MDRLASDPQSFLNRPGFEQAQQWLSKYEAKYSSDIKSYCDGLGLTEDLTLEEYLAITLPDGTTPRVGVCFKGDSPSYFSRERPTAVGGLMLPRIDPDVMFEIEQVPGWIMSHFAHGAPTLIPSDATGYANREEFWLLEFFVEASYDQVVDIVTNKVYGGDATKLRGFYNYLNPSGNPNYREYYWGGNYPKLAKIKAKYDLTNLFGNPTQVEPAQD